MVRAERHFVNVLPFCRCMHEPDLPTSPDGLLSWLPGEYDVLDDAQVYVEVSAHRRVCLLMLDLFSAVARPGGAA